MSSSFCHLQFPFAMLRIFGRWGKYHVRNSRETNKVIMPLWNLLFKWYIELIIAFFLGQESSSIIIFMSCFLSLVRKNIHHWIFALLQTSNTSILPREAPHGIYNYLSSGFWTLSRWRLEVMAFLNHVNLFYGQGGCFANSFTDCWE